MLIECHYQQSTHIHTAYLLTALIFKHLKIAAKFFVRLIIQRFKMCGTRVHFVYMLLSHSLPIQAPKQTRAPHDSLSLAPSLTQAVNGKNCVYAENQECMRLCVLVLVPAPIYML